MCMSECLPKRVRGTRTKKEDLVVLSSLLSFSLIESRKVTSEDEEDE